MENNTSVGSKSIAEKSISGFIWTFSGTGGQAIFQILTLAILARLLTPAEFGVAGSAVVITQFANIFSELGVGPAIVQRKDLTENHIRAGFTISIIFGFTIAIAIYLASPYAAVFFNTPELRDALKVYALSFLLKGGAVVSESILQRNLKFKTIAIIELTSYVFGYAVVGITLAYYSMGFWALVGAHTSQSIIKTIGTIVIAPVSIKPKFNKRALIELIHFGAGMTIGRIANYIANQGDNLVIGRTLGPEALGSYGRAYQLVVMPANLFGQVFDKVMFPTVAKSQNNPIQVGVYYNKTISLILWTLIPFSAFLWYLAPELIQVLLGNQWSSLLWSFRILSIGITFRVLHKVSDTIARSLGAVYKRACIQMLYAFLVITGAWIGHYDGITGIAFYVCIAIAINYVAMSCLCIRLTELPLKVYVISMLPGLTLGLTTCLILDRSVYILNQSDFPAFLKLLLCFLVLILIYLVPIRFNIKVLVGRQNTDIINNLRQQFINKKRIKT